MTDALQAPRSMDGKPLSIAGFKQRYTTANTASIPALWERLTPRIGSVPGQVANVAYGVMYNRDAQRNFDYLAGVEIADASQVPADWDTVRVPEQHYVVFAHPGHVSDIRRTWDAIWSKWLPQSGHAPAEGPMLERYGAGFDPQTGRGDIELWIPLQR